MQVPEGPLSENSPAKGILYPHRVMWQEIVGRDGDNLPIYGERTMSYCRYSGEIWAYIHTPEDFDLTNQFNGVADANGKLLRPTASSFDTAYGRNLYVFSVEAVLAPSGVFKEWRYRMSPKRVYD